jgi:phage shock protein PspC (stress-responsive transcriptional regulator)
LFVQQVQENVFTRPDTLFGVCQALGDDFGFNPLPLRVLFAVPLVWSPYVTVAAYLALGAVVLISRLLVPGRRKMAAVKPASNDVERAPALADPVEIQEELPLAA